MTADIEMTGGQAFRHNLRDLCAMVQRGRVVRVIQVQTGRHRAWFTRERPGGCDPVRITIWALSRTSGVVLEDVRDGKVFQVRDGEHRPVGYLYWAAEPWLAELLGSAPLAYTYTARSGRVIRRDMPALNVVAGPVPPRREVLVSG